MVQLDIVRSHNAAIFQNQHTVAVFAGATSGLGEATLRSLASSHGKQGKGLRFYVVGRKKASFDRVVADCKRLCPAGQFCFIQATDLALLQDVDKACAEITKQEQENATGEPARVDLLCMSQGDFTFSPHQDTKEGIEFRFSLLYYSRMKFIVNLMPLLQASRRPAHVISVFAAGGEGNLYLDDLSLRDPKHHGMAATRSHVAYLHTFFMEYLATQHPGRLSLVHVFPGLVMTPAFKNPGVPVAMKAVFTLFNPIIRLLTTPLAEAGDRILFLASPDRFPAKQTTEINSKSSVPTVPGPKVDMVTGSDGVMGGGAYSVDIKGNPVKNEQSYKNYRGQGVGEKLVAHTLKAFEDIKAGKVFQD